MQIYANICKIYMPLIYANIYITGEDPQAAQRAQAICQACDFQSNSLFVLPFGDHLLGYITRYAISLIVLFITTRQFIPYPISRQKPTNCVSV